MPDPAAPSSSGTLVDGVEIEDVVAALDTPCYLYSAGEIRAAYRRLDAAFGAVPHAIHYALKAGSTLGLVRLLAGLGARADANSIGEVEVALEAGVPPDAIVFTGVGKRLDELRRAVALGLLAINVESPGELDRLDAIARSLGRVARVALRINPDVDAGSHPHISTGLRENKFGVPQGAAPGLFREIARRDGLRAVGVHVHIGSQVASMDALIRAARAAVSLAVSLRAEGVPLEHVDFGGGLGISYDGTPMPDAADYAGRLAALIEPTGLTALVEPGRSLVGPAGRLLTRVVDVKHVDGGRRFVVLDAGMTELIRPALYAAFHRIVPASPRAGAPVPADIVGPVCETSDTFARNLPMPPVEPGDLMVIHDVGAYGSAMASTYLRRPLAPEALADAGAWTVIRRRQTLDDMLGLER